MAGKKGMPVWGWLLIGCGGIVVLGLIAFLVLGGILFNKAKNFVEDAEANPAYGAIAPIAMVSPEIDIVSRDDAKQSVTVRNNNTGEEVTVNLEDIENGKISWLTDNGAVTIETDQSGDGGMTVTTDEGKITYGAGDIQTPVWVPLYPEAKLTPVTQSEVNGIANGNIAFETPDGMSAVHTYMQERLEGANWEIDRTDINETIMLMGKRRDQELIISYTPEGGVTKGQVVYSGPVE